MDFDKVINVGISDMNYASSPMHLRTNLGSCVALILYDTVKKVGGLVHIMLPKAYKGETKIAKFADTAVPALINGMISKWGCEKKSLVAKIFGGAKILNISPNDIGKNITEEVIRLVGEHEIKIKAIKTGGMKGYVVQLDTSTGMVACKIFGKKVEYF